MKERRKHKRYDLELPSYIYVQDKEQKTPIESKTSNISSGGAFLYTKDPLEEGVKVEVELFLSKKNIHPDNEDSESILISSCFVVRTATNGMAVCFELPYHSNFS